MAPTDCDITMPYLLCEIGHRLKGASGALAANDEVISQMDHLRRAAFTKNKVVLDKKPPVFLSDTLQPTSFLLNNPHCTDEPFKKGTANLYAVGDLGVVGGAILETTRASIPVTILFTRWREGVEPTLVMHIAHAPAAGLEAELYDSAFFPSEGWESNVFLNGEYKEHMLHRKETAVECREIGMHMMQSFLKDDSHNYNVRRGSLPFLSLRQPVNIAEWKAVCADVEEMLGVLPVCDVTVNSDLGRYSRVLTAMVVQTGPPAKRAEFVEPSDQSKSASASTLMNHATLTFVAAIMLQLARDDAEDAQGERINEYNLAVRPHPDNHRCIQQTASVERSALEAARRKPASALAMAIPTDDSYSIPNIMKDMGRSFSTSLVAEKADDMSAFLESVASSIFCKEDLTYVLQACRDLPSMLSICSAMCALGKCLVERQAILVMVQTADGRFEDVRLASSGGVVAKVARHNVPRLIISPCVTTLVVDKNRVKLLSVVEPEYIRDCNVLKHEALRLKASEKCLQSATSPADKKTIDSLVERVEQTATQLKSMGEEIEKMRAVNAKLATENAALASSAVDVKRKVDILVTKALEQEERAAKAPEPPPVPPRQESKTVSSLKRLRQKLTLFDRRLCQRT